MAKPLPFMFSKKKHLVYSAHILHYLYNIREENWEVYVLKLAAKHILVTEL